MEELQSNEPRHGCNNENPNCEASMHLVNSRGLSKLTCRHHRLSLASPKCTTVERYNAVIQDPRDSPYCFRVTSYVQAPQNSLKGCAEAEEAFIHTYTRN